MICGPLFNRNNLSLSFVNNVGFIHARGLFLVISIFSSYQSSQSGSQSEQVTGGSEHAAELQKVFFLA